MIEVRWLCKDYDQISLLSSLKKYNQNMYFKNVFGILLSSLVFYSNSVFLSGIHWRCPSLEILSVALGATQCSHSRQGGRKQRSSQVKASLLLCYLPVARCWLLFLPSSRDGYKQLILLQEYAVIFDNPPT